MAEAMTTSGYHFRVSVARGKIHCYKAPPSIAFVKELPKGATGTILKRVLRAH